MDVGEASSLLDVALVHSANMNWSVWWLREFVGENQLFVDFRRAAGAVMGEIFVSVLKPVERAAPELAIRIYEPAQVPLPEPPDPKSVYELRERCLMFSESLSAWLSTLRLPTESHNDFFAAIDRYRTLSQRLAV